MHVPKTQTETEITCWQRAEKKTARERKKQPTNNQ